MTVRPDELAKQLDASLADVAGALYDLDSGADMVFVKAQADLGNVQSAGLVASLGLAWERYPLAKDAVERLAAALAAHDHAAVEALAGPAAVALPDGSKIGIAALIEDVALRVEHVGADVARVAGAARAAVAKVDAARTAFQDVLVRAGAVGADDDVEITRVRAAIDQATAAVAADPAEASGLGDLDQLLDVARQRVEVLERSQRELPAELAAATTELDEIEALVARGAEALARTQEKIAAPPGVRPPVDLAADGDHALRPWLERIRGQSGEAAAAALAAWRRAADGRLAEAKAVAAANGAPLARRNELRGLLDAYRAKAAASGGDEDGRLARLHAAARDTLYTAPCDLAVAETQVREYVEAVNSVARGAR